MAKRGVDLIPGMDLTAAPQPNSTAPERPKVTRKMMLNQPKFHARPAAAYMDAIEAERDAWKARAEEAVGIIEQYPRMVRNILRRVPVRNVDELEGHAQSWLKEAKNE